MTEILLPALVKTAAAWEEQGALARFRRALRRRDQLVLDDLLQGAPIQADMTLSPELSVEAAVLSMLLEEQKRLLLIQEGLRELVGRNAGDG
jgi:hypothetical protein